jgi:hypothetical protein
VQIFVKITCTVDPDQRFISVDEGFDFSEPKRNFRDSVGGFLLGALALGAS